MRSLINKSLLKLIRRNVKVQLQQVSEPHRSITIGIQQHIKGRQITTKSIRQFNKYIKLRSCHFPIQYLCKSWPFRELDLILKKPVLIPRYQSEYMIQVLKQALQQKYGKQKLETLKFVEYGCGSGALGLSLAKQFGMSGVLIDVHPASIQLTKLNAQRNNINLQKLQIVLADMSEMLHQMLHADVVISNPPYLSQQHYYKYLNPQIKRFQDKNALVAGENGLKFLKMILNKWKQRNKEGVLILQFDGRKLQKELQYLQTQIVNDQYGKRRFILIKN